MIQATSLSGVVDLADNPPPSAHTGVEISDPLILYVARVPGSRDVFLTTTKPLQKVVTAQDVQSSLYYIHVDDDVDDERIRQTSDSSRIDGSEAEPQGSVDTAREAIRKPLGSDPHHFVETQPTGAHIIHPHHQMPLAPSYGMSQIVRKPVSNNIEARVDTPYTRSEPLNPRIMGPRAMRARLHSDHSPGLGLSRGKENTMPRRWPEQPSVLHPSSSPERGPQRDTPNLMDNTQYHDPRDDISFQHPSRNQEAVLSPHSGQRCSIDRESAGLSLTLIRRYNGNQWNVGKISTICDPSSLWENDSATRHNTLSILISSPGYSRFRTPDTPATSTAADRSFERHLTRLRRRNQSLGLFEKSPNSMDNRKPRLSIDFRRLSKPRLDTTSEKAMCLQTSLENNSTSIKGYGFYSPWNGSCEFTSSISGHALKCKYTAPTEGSQAVTVSEIRFNLPTSTSRSSVTPRDLKSSPRLKNVKRSSYFSNEHGSEPDYPKEPLPEPKGDDDKSDHLGLSLGQEHAGGGFGGKRAKLGKLIIEPEGLKMLDLLVAANMGLWWKAYEKSA
ncbi:MAG: hypothetical protein LQ343_001448 [Gyalolechia ehrenbergii]|nr:MAG: hypothetical protein LQ343_001448 [Gyalolechia ehrenbergii]